MSAIIEALQPGMSFVTEFGQVKVAPNPTIQPALPCVSPGWVGRESFFGSKCAHFVFPSCGGFTEASGCKIALALGGNDMALNESTDGLHIATTVAHFLGNKRLGMGGEPIQCTVFERT